MSRLIESRIPPTSDFNTKLYHQIKEANEQDIPAILIANKLNTVANPLLASLFQAFKYDPSSNIFSVQITKQLLLEKWDIYNSNSSEENKQENSPNKPDYTAEIRSDFYKTYKEYGMNKISDGNLITQNMR